jgi:hypothetical protein
MAIQTINLGTYANDGTGDDLRTAFQKVNANILELYNSVYGANVGAVPPTSGVEEGELWWSTVEGRLYVYYSGAWVDASPVDGFVTYDLTAETTTGGASVRLNGTDLSQDSIKFAAGANIIVTRTDANTITLSAPSFNGNVTGNLTGNVTGNLTGNTSGVHNGTVNGNVTGNLLGDTEGLHTGAVIGNVTGDVLGDTTGTHNGAVIGNVTGNLLGDTTGTHNGAVIGNVTGNLTGNADTVTNGVYTTSSINVLSDVNTATAPPTSGQALVWDGTNWIPGTITAGVSRIIAGTNITINPTNGLGEVTITSIASGGGSGGSGIGSFDFGSFTSPATDIALDMGSF